jgi:hypothetical protein
VPEVPLVVIAVAFIAPDEYGAGLKTHFDADGALRPSVCSWSVEPARTVLRGESGGNATRLPDRGSLEGRCGRRPLKGGRISRIKAHLHLSMITVLSLSVQICETAV